MLEQIADSIINSTIGMDSTTLLGGLAFLSIVCRMLGKIIPDDATGVLAVVRRVCKLLGLYVSNRLTSATTADDVARRNLGITD